MSAAPLHRAAPGGGRGRRSAARRAAAAGASGGGGSGERVVFRLLRRADLAQLQEDCAELFIFGKDVKLESLLEQVGSLGGGGDLRGPRLQLHVSLTCDIAAAWDIRMHAQHHVMLPPLLNLPTPPPFAPDAMFSSPSAGTASLRPPRVPTTACTHTHATTQHTHTM